MIKRLREKTPYTVNEVSKYLGRSKWTIYSHIKKGRCPTAKFIDLYNGDRPRWILYADDVRELNLWRRGK